MNPCLNSRRDSITKQFHLSMALRHTGLFCNKRTFWSSIGDLLRVEGINSRPDFCNFSFLKQWMGWIYSWICPAWIQKSSEHLMTEQWTNPVCKCCVDLISIPSLVIFYFSEETDPWITQNWSYKPKLFKSKKNVGNSSKIKFLHSVTKKIYTPEKLLQNCIE